SGGRGALVLVLGCVVTAFIWPGFWRSSGGGGGGSPPPAQVESLLAFLPADPMMLFGADLTRLEKRNELDKLLAKLPAEISKNVPTIPVAVRNVMENVETIVGGVTEREAATFVARTKAPFKKEDILRDAKAAPERDVQGFKLTTVPGQFGKDIQLHLDANNKLIVLSTAPEAEFVQLLKDKKGLAGDAKALAQRIGGSPAWLAIQLKG